GWNNPVRLSDPNGNCPNCKEYAKAFWGGVKDGAKSTVNFVKSLGTSQGRENAVVGTMRFFEMFAPYVDPPAETQANLRQFYGGIENYVRSVPDKTGTQLAHDAGYGLEKVAETVAVSKGANLVKGAIVGEAAMAGETIQLTKVGRWMSKTEYSAMLKTGRIQEGGGGMTFFSVNGANDFKGAAKAGSIYVEFELPTNSLLQGGKDGWLKAIGPNSPKSQQFMLQKQGGEMLPMIKNLSKPLDIK
ncbi:MAG: hypothetical protein ACK41Z_14230, partial [Sediminibacterium sp.]